MRSWRRRLHEARLIATIAFWTLVVFPSSFLVTWITGSHRIGHRVHARFWGRAILRTAGVRLQVHGAGRIPPDRGAILLLNHGTFLGAFAVAAGLDLQWRCVLDRRFRRIPVFGWIGRLAGHVFLEREGGPDAVRALNDAGKLLGEGISLLVFPEGKYDADGGLGELRSGAFHLAARTGAPVLVLTSVETVDRGRIRAVDLHVSRPLAAVDVEALREEARAEMARHLVDGRFRRRLRRPPD